jgi:hypothetical protein
LSWDDEPIRCWWTFTCAEVDVLPAVAFWPSLAAFIPHYFLG